MTFLNLPLVCFSLFAASGGTPAANVVRVPDDFPTIQAAIDSADGSMTIQIAAGTYFEQLYIRGKTGVALEAEPGAVLAATSDLAETLKPWTTGRALIAIAQSQVSVVGLTIDGNRMAGAYDADTFRGICFIGSSGSVERCTLRGFRGSTFQTHNGADALRVWNPQIVSAEASQLLISSNRFEDNEQSITLAGDDRNLPTQLRTTFTVEGNTIVGPGPIGVAVDGVVILTGASGVFRGNTITDHQYTGTGDPYASAINAFDGLGNSRSPARFIPLQPIRFEGNTFRNNDHLVIINGANSSVSNNVFDGPAASKARWGALAFSGNGISVANNDFSGVPTGIVVFGNDRYFSGWPSIPAAMNPVLENNWFCDVAEQIRIRPTAVSVQVRDSATCPFRPILSSELNTTSPVRVPAIIALRSWHGQRAVMESSENLKDWTPVNTNSMSLPVLRFEEVDPQKASQRFYRTVLAPN